MMNSPNGAGFGQESRICLRGFSLFCFTYLSTNESTTNVVEAHGSNLRLVWVCCLGPD